MSSSETRGELFEAMIDAVKARKSGRCTIKRLMFLVLLAASIFAIIRHHQESSRMQRVRALILKYKQNEKYFYDKWLKTRYVDPPAARVSLEMSIEAERIWKSLEKRP